MPSDQVLLGVSNYRRKGDTEGLNIRVYQAMQDV